jgi:hypothetical protein
MADIKELKDKIYLQRGVHSFYEEKYRKLGLIYKICIILIPSLITFFSIADTELIKNLGISISIDNLRAICALLSFVLLVVTIAIDPLNIAEKFNEHKKTLNRYTILLRDLKEVEYNQSSKNTLENLEIRYRDISQNCISITDKNFAFAEKKYLQRWAKRNIIKSNPFLKGKKLKKLIIEESKKLRN